MIEITTTDIYNLVENKITQNLQTYVWRDRLEHPKAYALRLKRTSYDNWLKKAVNILLGYFLKDHKFKGERPDLDAFATVRAMGYHAIVGGAYYRLTLPGPRIIVFRKDAVKGEPREAPARWEAAAPEGIYVVERNGEKGRPLTVQLWNRDKAPLGPAVDLAEKAWSFVSWTEDGESVLVGAAQLAIVALNLGSHLDDLLFELGRTYLFGPKQKEGERPYYSTYIPLAESMKSPGSVTTGSPEAVRLIGEAYRSKIFDIGRLLGLESEFAEELKFESGISKSFSLIDINAWIAALGVAVQQDANEAFALAELFSPRPNDQREGNEKGEPVSVSLSRELKPDSRSADAQLLREVAPAIDVQPFYAIAYKNLARLAVPGMTPREEAEVFAAIDEKAKAGALAPPRDFVGDSLGLPSFEANADGNGDEETAGGSEVAAKAEAKAVAFNGAQIASALEIVLKTGGAGEDRLSPAQARAFLEETLGMTPEKAARLLSK